MYMYIHMYSNQVIRPAPLARINAPSAPSQPRTFLLESCASNLLRAPRRLSPSQLQPYVLRLRQRPPPSCSAHCISQTTSTLLTRCTISRSENSLPWRRLRPNHPCGANISTPPALSHTTHHHHHHHHHIQHGIQSAPNKRLCTLGKCLAKRSRRSKHTNTICRPRRATRPGAAAHQHR